MKSGRKMSMNDKFPDTFEFIDLPIIDCTWALKTVNVYKCIMNGKLCEEFEYHISNFGCSQHTMDQRPKKHATLTKWMHVTHGCFLHWWHLQNHWRKHLNTNVAHFGTMYTYLLPNWTGQTGMDFEHVHPLSAWIFFDSSIHPGKLTWPKNGGGWKMMFQWAIRGRFRFHVHFPVAICCITRYLG